MSNHPRPWHRGSIFGDGHRVPMDREHRAVWKARVEIHRKAGRITDGYSYVALALLKRLGTDGRCDPSHQTLADDSGESVDTVKRALKALHGLSLVEWLRRLIRAATVFFVSLSTPLNLLSDCRRARCGQGQAASRWPLAILDLRCARRRGRGQVGTKERSGFDRTKERGISSLVVGRVPSRVCRASWR